MDNGGHNALHIYYISCNVWIFMVSQYNILDTPYWYHSPLVTVVELSVLFIYFWIFTVVDTLDQECKQLETWYRLVEWLCRKCKAWGGTTLQYETPDARQFQKST